MKVITEADKDGEGKTSDGSEKSVQILQIEPRTAPYSLEGVGEEEEESAPTDNEIVDSKSDETNGWTNGVAKGTTSEKDGSARRVATKNTESVVQKSSSLVARNAKGGANGVKRGGTFDRSNSKDKSKQSSKEAAGNDVATNDRTFETMSDEFSRSLRNEKIRLQKTIDRQLSSTDMIKANGANGSVIDSIQDAARPNIGGGAAGGARISNGLSATGYDLTQIKDEHGRTVLHLAAAKDQKRNTFYKMLSQADYLVAERDSKYRTIRDVAVLNGIKNNLQVIDQFILDCFIKERREYLKMLMLEGYSTLLTVVDAEGNDVIALLKKHSITTMEPFVHELAEIQVGYLVY